jgi:Spy/CpxP family protein refolding chaperone
MRIFSQILFVAVIVLLDRGPAMGAFLEAPAAENEQNNPFGLPGEWSSILRQESVLKDLKLTAKQVESIQTILNDASLKQEQIRKQVGDTLSAEQVARLKQSSRQISGGFALFEPDVAIALGLTPQQQKKLSEISEKAYGDMKNFMSRARFRSKDAVDKYILGCRDRAGELLLAELTSEQRKKFDDLKGKPPARTN